MQRLIWLVVVMSVVGCGYGANITASNSTCSVPQLPKAYRFKELFWTWTHQMVVESDAADGSVIEHGNVVWDLFSFRSVRTWHYPKGQDGPGEFIAQSHRNLISMIVEVFLDDCEDKEFAEMSELHNYKVKEFLIRSPGGDQLARSQKYENFETTIDLVGMDGKELVRITRPWFQVCWEWQIEVRSEEIKIVADPRLVVLLLANVTASGNLGLGGLSLLLALLIFISCWCACWNYSKRKNRDHESYQKIEPASNNNNNNSGPSNNVNYGTWNGPIGLSDPEETSVW